MQQVGRVELGGRVGDLDPSLLNSRNLSWVGQVGQVEFGGRVNDVDPSAPFCEPYPSHFTESALGKAEPPRQELFCMSRLFGAGNSNNSNCC